MPEKSRNVRVGKANSKRLLKRNASAVARGGFAVLAGRSLARTP